jgi:hypothetical protein
VIRLIRIETLVSLRDQGYNVSNDAIAALVQADVRLWQRGEMRCATASLAV